MKVTKSILIAMFQESRTGKSLTMMDGDKVFTVPSRLADSIIAGDIASVELTKEDTIDNGNGDATTIVKPDPTTIVEVTVESKLDRAIALQEKAAQLDEAAIAKLTALGL